MTTDSTTPDETLRRSLKELSELRQFRGMPREFWASYQMYLAELTGAHRVVLLLRDKTDATKWRKIGEWSSNTGPSRFVVPFVTQLDSYAERCVQAGEFFSPVERSVGPKNALALGVRLKLQNPDDACVAIVLLLEADETLAREGLVRMQLAADVPRAYQSAHAAQNAKADVEKFASALDLMVAVNAETRFLAAALAFCNGLATRFNCDRVSLGWLEGGYIRLRAMSRTEKFDRQMQAAQQLEKAMEESVDQDDEVVWPAADGSTVITRDHEAFSREQRVENLCSLPLRVEEKVVAALTCERQQGAFTANELQQLRLCCDQAARRLADLKKHDRWFGARAATATREKLAKVLGPEHTWAKMLTILIVAALAVLFFVPVNYRVEGNFIVRSDDVSFLTAPFDGYISDVFVRAGDVVQKDGRLVALDTNELLLDESAALADMNRYFREAEKARAAGALADMRIAHALADQAKARLDLIRYRLERAIIRVPFDGVVVEGDLRDRLKAPVKQGDALLKVAKLQTLYVEAEIDERDVHEILNRKAGEIAFVTQPKLKYPVKIARIEPAAMPKKDGNFFLVRCEFDGGPQPWWRPGMSGVCKLSVEKRTLFWIISHRTVDFLRLKFWW
jgi:multidrug resistance efflux pump